MKLNSVCVFTPRACASFRTADRISAMLSVRCAWPDSNRLPGTTPERLTLALMRRARSALGLLRAGAAAAAGEACRGLRAGLSVGTVVHQRRLRQWVELHVGLPALRRRLHGHAARFLQLRRLRHELPERSGVQLRQLWDSLGVRHRPDSLWFRLRRHPPRHIQLWQLWKRLHRRSTLHQWCLWDLPFRAGRVFASRRHGHG